MFVQRRGGVIALIGALALLMSACGSDGAETATTSDDGSTAAETVSDGAETVSDGAENVSDVAEPVAEADPVEEASSTEASAVEKTTTTKAAAVTTTEAPVEQFIPDPGPGLGAFAVRVFEGGELGLSPSEQGCVDGRLQAELRIDRTDEFDELTIEQQATSIEILFDCAGARLEPIFLEDFEVTDDMRALGFDESFGTCIFQELSRDDDVQPLAILAIAYVTADQPAPEEAIDPGSRVFARCFDIATVLANSFGADPAMAELLDIECVRALDEDATIALFAGAFRDPDGEDPTVLADSFRAVRPCMRFGQMVATGFAPVVLSDAEITCIDAAFNSDEVFDAMITGTDLPASANDALIACLSADTLQALGG